MPTFNLSKKLQPARKAWKSFANHLRSKLCRYPKFVKAITSLRQYCMVAWRSVARFIRQKILALTKRPSLHYHGHHLRTNYPAIYVDELFPGPAVPLAEPRKNKENMDESKIPRSAKKSRPESTKATSDAEKILKKPLDTSNAEIHVYDEKGSAAAAGPKGKAKVGESSNSSAAADKWKIPLLPQFRGIDERAEEFIAKFRQDMRLEREQSIQEFEEMLKRSA